MPRNKLNLDQRLGDISSIINHYSKRKYLTTDALFEVGALWSLFFKHQLDEQMPYQ